MICRPGGPAWAPPAPRIWAAQDTGDLNSRDECRRMAELTYRAVLHAQRAAGDRGSVVLSRVVAVAPVHGVRPFAGRGACLAASITQADLHCHLGGCLSVADQVGVGAAAFEALPQGTARDAWTHVAPFVEKAKRGEDRSSWLAGVHDSGVSIPIYARTAAFLRAFQGDPEAPDCALFGPYMQEEEFVGVCDGSHDQAFHDWYEQLRDLAGSRILQTREALDETVRRAVLAARGDNVRYLELRGSPWKYRDGSLSPLGVLGALASAADRYGGSGIPEVRVRFIVNS